MRRKTLNLEHGDLELTPSLGITWSIHLEMGKILPKDLKND